MPSETHQRAIQRLLPPCFQPGKECCVWARGPRSNHILNLHDFFSTRHKVVVCRDLGADVMPLLRRSDIDVRVFRPLAIFPLDNALKYYDPADCVARGSTL
jgi:hypothetical protein